MVSVRSTVEGPHTNSQSKEVRSGEPLCNGLIILLRQRAPSGRPKVAGLYETEVTETRFTRVLFRRTKRDNPLCKEGFSEPPPRMCNTCRKSSRRGSPGYKKCLPDSSLRETQDGHTRAEVCWMLGFICPDISESCSGCPGWLQDEPAGLLFRRDFRLTPLGRSHHKARLIRP
jgi:hypothetical protein